MAKITAQLTGSTTVKISDGRHDWGSDEPLGVGTDTAPNPYEQLLGSLAACTCITLSLYCRHKGIALNGVSVAYEYERVHADDCDECEEEMTGFIDRIRGKVEIDADANEAQQKRLREVAVRCPVHKTLANPIVFTDTVVFG